MFNSSWFSVKIDLVLIYFITVEVGDLLLLGGFVLVPVLLCF